MDTAASGERVVVGGIVGTAAVLAIAAVVWLLVAPFVGRFSLLQQAKTVGLYVYAAHFVGIVETMTVDGMTRSAPRPLRTLLEPPLATFLPVVPAAVATLAGGIAAQVRRNRAMRERARDGALIVVGYFPVTLAGLLVVPYTQQYSVVAPDTLQAIVLMGFAFPLAFGALGGLLSGVAAARASSAW